MKTTIENQSGVHFEEQLIGEISHTDESVGFGTHYWNPAYYVAQGDIHNIIPDGEGWSTVKGDENTEAALILNGLTDVYYIKGQDKCLVMRNVKDSTINLEATYFSEAIYLKDCVNIEVKLNSRCCGIGVIVADCEDIRISSGDYSYTAKAHVQVKRSRNIEVSGNNMSYGCLGESTGGIYFSDTTNSLIKRNYIVFNGFGNYWKLDGGCIYMEHGSENNEITENALVGSHLALQDNSGCENIWNKNTLIGCKYSIDITDASNVNRGYPVYCGNVLIGTPDESPRNGANNRQIIIV